MSFKNICFIYQTLEIIKNVGLAMWPCAVVFSRLVLLASGDGSCGHSLERGDIAFVTVVDRMID